MTPSPTPSPAATPGPSPTPVPTSPVDLLEAFARVQHSIDLSLAVLLTVAVLACFVLGVMLVRAAR